jgi:amino acid transporter
MDFFPDFKRITTLVLILGFALTFAGIEASASHAGRVIKPHRNYPIAIFLVVVLGLLVNLLGACSIAIVVPKGAISMVSGIMEAFDMFLSKLGVRWFVPFIGILVAGGAIGGINAWLTGPVQGLLETAKKGDLPPIFRKVNKNGVPIDLLFMQGILISLIAIVLMMSPNPNIAFWISVDLTVTIYLAMYFMMMLSGIYLRYKKPKVLRTYRIPGKKNIGMWIVSSVGMLAILCFFSVALFPPQELPKEGHVTYFIIILFSLSLVFSIPFIIERYKKKSWAKRKIK